jgi:pyrimidine-specific ribonucleoside hydrolase
MLPPRTKSDPALSGAAGTGRPRAVVIDCDPGIDDAAALALAVGSPELDVRGVTTVAGNVELELTTGNALRLLAAFGRDDVPVAPGAARGLMRTKAAHAFVHGRNGLGGVELPAARRAARSEHAVELLAAVLRESEPGSVTIAAIGPLTNIALLASMHPELTERIDRVVVMGATAGRGNMTPVAEYNVWADPEAAQRVLGESDFEICLVELEVTRRATVGPRELARLRAESARGALLADMIDGYADQAVGGRPLHDAVAVAAIVDPTLIATRPATIEVDTGSGSGRASTAIAFGEAGAGGAGRLNVAVDLDVARFRELLLTRVAGGAGEAAGA